MLLLCKIVAILVSVFLFVNLLIILLLLLLVHEGIAPRPHSSRGYIKMISGSLSISGVLIDNYHAAIVSILVGGLLSRSQLTRCVASPAIGLFGLGDLRSSLGLHVFCRLRLFFFKVNFFLSNLSLIICGVCLRGRASLLLSIDPLKQPRLKALSVIILLLCLRSSTLCIAGGLIESRGISACQRSSPILLLLSHLSHYIQVLRLQDKLLLLIINLFGWLRLLLLTAIIIRVHDHDIMVMVVIACDFIHRRTVIVVWRKLLRCLKIHI